MKSDRRQLESRPQPRPTPSGMTLRRTFFRAREIMKLRRTLERDEYPRLQMLFLVTLTTLAGLGASFVMLRAGVESMLWRYLFAVACAYVMFLFLLWCWLRWRNDDRLDLDLDIPLPDLAGGGSQLGAGDVPGFSGGAGAGGGAGASGSVESHLPVLSPGSPNIKGFDGSPVVEAAGDLVGDADDGIPVAIVLLIIALVASIVVLGALYIVYLAPALFAELMVDVLLAAGLYRKMRTLQRRHWLETAIRRTVVPFLVTAVVLAGLGYFLQKVAPGAATLNAAVRQVRTESR